MRRRCRPGGRAQRGVALVEFVLVFPILMVIQMFILSVALLMWSEMQLSHYANTAARACIAQRPNGDDDFSGCITAQINNARGTYNLPAWGLQSFASYSTQYDVPSTRQKILCANAEAVVQWSPAFNLMPGIGFAGTTTTLRGTSCLPYIE